MATYKDIRREKKKKLLEERCRGQYLYQNITSADILLPTPLANGDRIIPSMAKFIGNGFYKSMVPLQLKILRTLEDPNPKAAPEVKEELESLLPLGEDVKVEEEIKVEVVEESEEIEGRPELTEEILKDLRVKQKLSWSKIAKQTGYSVTFIRKRCKQYEIS